MKKWLLSLALACTPLLAHGANQTLTVFQDPNCGCCGGWAQYMQNEGYTVNTVITNNIGAVKQKLGIPPPLSSCHTAVVEETGHIIEGHVPVRANEELLDQTDTTWVAVTGMHHNRRGMGAS